MHPKRPVHEEQHCLSGIAAAAVLGALAGRRLLRW